MVAELSDKPHSEIDMLIKIGADPELFIINNNNGEPISAHDIIPGTKDSPFNVWKGAVQVDGLAAEFNIDPATTANEFVHNIFTVRQRLDTMLNNNRPGYGFSIDPVAEFSDFIWSDVPDYAKTLGCNPDIDAWTQMTNVMPDSSKPIRMAGGHIHIGWTKNKDIYDSTHFADAMAVARQLDYYVGMPSLIWDTDGRRRQMYGRAGACRVKPYGVEYRVPSNAWLKDVLLQRFVFNSTKKAVIALNNGISAQDMFQNQAQDVINGNHTDWFTTINGQNLIATLDLDVQPIIETYAYPAYSLKKN